MIFFPSYQYLDQVAEVFKETYPSTRTLIQGTKLNEQEREDFLAEFIVEPQETLVGFCVLGGIFSEGIDLRGSRLIGSMIVGVGLPKMNHEQELIKSYYDEKRTARFCLCLPVTGNE